MIPPDSCRPETPHSRPPRPAEGVTIEDLIEQYYPYICRLAYLILADPDEAQDAARRLESFRGEAQPGTWPTVWRALCRLRKIWMPKSPQPLSRSGANPGGPRYSS
jgi:hypothetical protein